MLDVCLLGTGGMQPLPGRRLSAVLIRVGAAMLLLDCGEGTQVAVRERGWGLRNLHTVLLTHLHADHLLGLPGLLLTLGHAGRGADEPLTVYGPAPLPDVLEGLMRAAGPLPYPLHTVVLAGGETVVPAGMAGVAVRCAAGEHGVPCLAYAVEVRREPRFDPHRARALDVPLPLWNILQHGGSVEHNGRRIDPAEVRGAHRRGRRVVLATDTRPTRDLAAFIASGDGTDLLIADGMYGDAENKPTRWESQHMTFAESAGLARDGGARHLWLTHFSPALSEPEAYLDRATMIFPATTIGHDGLTQTLVFEDD